MKQFLINYLKDNKAWIKFSLKWFVFAAAIGALSYFFKPDLINQIIQIFAEKFGDNPELNFSLARQVSFQNALVSLLALIGGAFFGISSFFIVFVNGFILGIIILSVIFSSADIGKNFLYLVLGLLPHGIFELPAFLLSSAIGMRLGTEWLARNSAGRRFKVFKNDLKRAVIILPMVLIVLMIAAVVEIFVTGRILGQI